MTRSVAEVIEEFERCGISIADWSRQNDVNPSLVYQVLKGRHIPKRGQSHKIAVLLGIKKGVVFPTNSTK